MHNRGRAAIVHIIWAVAGVAVGATVALLWIGKLKSEWVAATGTWFGATATVLTLLWAVQTFRADQAHREQQRIDRDQAQREADEALAATQQRELLQAAAELESAARRVSVSIAGGAGQGSGSDLLMTSVHLSVTNDTAGPVTIKELRFLPPLVAKSYPQVPLRLQSNETRQEQVQVELINVESHELSGAPLTRFAAEIVYGLDGRLWTRTSVDDSTPTLLE